MKKVKIPIEQFIKTYTTTEGKKIQITTSNQCPICMKPLSFYRDIKEKNLIVTDDCDHK